MSVDDYDTRYRVSGVELRIGGQPIPAAAEMVRMVTVPIRSERVRLSIGHAPFVTESAHRRFHANEAALRARLERGERVERMPRFYGPWGAR